MQLKIKLETLSFCFLLILFLFVNCKKADPAKDVVVGGIYQGGIVAYILQKGDPGFDPKLKHGIIAATSDQNDGKAVSWFNGGNYDVLGASGTAIGTGNANTMAIVNKLGVGSYAARYCSDLVSSGYSDWYLPSSDELTLLYTNRIAIGGFSSKFYCSSSEVTNFAAWRIDFTNGVKSDVTKDLLSQVRAIRAF